MTLKTICQNALREISGFEVPDSFVGSSNDTAITCLNLVRREGTRLCRKYKWVELVTEATITTVASQQAYTKPSDFKMFANMSQWDRTNNFPVSGPVTSAEWQFLNSSVIGNSATITRWFMVRGTNINIYPIPSVSGDTIAYDYYSKNWITKQSDGSGATDFENDNDTVKLDENLLTLGLKWRFLQAKGFPFETEYRDYEDFLDSVREQDGGARKLRMDENFQSGITIVPESGFGLP